METIKCSYCKRIIYSYMPLYVCCDTFFCLYSCSMKRLDIILQHDPNMLNPYMWRDI